MKSIYLAGKIGKNDWRHKVTPGLREASAVQGERVANVYHESEMPNWWDYNLTVLRTWRYAGPFFSGCDHGCAHDPDDPGHAITGGCISAATRREDWGHGTGYRPWVHEQCLESIRRCDVFFAWLDNTTAYGTLVEIGLARGLGKYTVVATRDRRPQGTGPSGLGPLDDLWFACETADTRIVATTPRLALADLATRGWQ